MVVLMLGLISYCGVIYIFKVIKNLYKILTNFQFEERKREKGGKESSFSGQFKVDKIKLMRFMKTKYFAFNNYIFELCQNSK